jgi:hypothetical protein
MNLTVELVGKVKQTPVVNEKFTKTTMVELYVEIEKTHGYSGVVSHEIYPVAFYGGKADMCLKLIPGNAVRVTASLSSREYAGRYYLGLKGESLTAIDAVPAAKPLADNVAEIPF